MITAKKVFKYALLPQLAPRIRGLFFSGFSYAAFFMAQIYRAVRLLPEGHPYLNPANMGRFGMRHAIAQAGLNLTYRKENLDQIAIYFLTIAGLALLALQCLMLLCVAFVEAAHAGGLYDSSRPQDFFLYFQTPNALHELSFVLLDRVFGIPGGGGNNTSFFSDVNGQYTCVVQGKPCFHLDQSTRVITPDNKYFTSIEVDGDSIKRAGEKTFDNFPWPFHEALRGMIQVYSVGLLVIGIMVFCYFIFAVAAETAESGTAFGKRFSHLWAPIRMVVAMGLLVPIAHGLNPAQWILMYAAKWGSSFATNGWVIYNNSAASEETMLGQTARLVATPNAPPVNTLMEFGSLLAVCKLAYERKYYKLDTPGAEREAVEIDAWLINPKKNSMAPKRLTGTSFQQAVEYFDKGDIIVRFGEDRGEENQSKDGRIAPHCGEIAMQITYVPASAGGDMTEPGSWKMLESYYDLIGKIWKDASGDGGGSGLPGMKISFKEIGEKMVDRHICLKEDKCEPIPPLPTPDQMSSLPAAYAKFVKDTIAQAVKDQQGSKEWLEKLTQLGWGGAGIWYNKIAQLNGGLVSAVYSMPTVKKFPYVMEQVLKEQSAANPTVSGENRYRLNTGTNVNMVLDDASEADIADALFQTQTIWRANYSVAPRSNNIFIDAINTIFGTEGLFNIMKNDEQNIHPLAQLASIGRSIVDSAVRNFGYSAAAGLGGGILNLFQEYLFSSVAKSAASFLFQIAMLGLSIGFVLFYVIPFLPFIYFFFAVGGWVKGIFEAMVGVPLWALAHIRIDGDGLPSEAAMGGYYLILEVFLRPFFIIMGFIAAITIFAAQIQILNEVWSMVVSNVAGFNIETATSVAKGETGSIDFLRSAVDELFYTIMYALLAYMMAMSSFKLIDQIPNHILRWMGANVSSFGEQNNDPAQHLVRNSFLGTNMISGPMRQAMGGLTGGFKGGASAMGELFTNNKK